MIMHKYSKPLSFFMHCFLTIAMLGVAITNCVAQQPVFGSHAGITKPGQSQALTGSALVNGAQLVNDFNGSINLNPDAAALDNSQPSVVEHVISFSLNDNYVIPKGFTATVSFNVKVGANLNAALGASPLWPQNKTLKINYDPSAGINHDAKQYIYFKTDYTGPECVVVTISGVTTQIVTSNNGGNTTTNITQLPNTSIDARNVVSFENKIEPTYYYQLKNGALPYVFAVPPQVTTTGNITPDEMIVTWSWVDSHGNSDIGNNYTQLEWTWLEDDMADVYKVGGIVNTDLLFKNNATRVDLPPAGIKYYKNDNSFAGQGYKIPLLYDGEGHIYCRIRAVNIHADGSIEAGPWCTTNMSGDGTPGSVAAAAFGGHNNNLNWQVTTSFAEEGKRKTVIQYFDGSLRGRQTVTKDNSTNTIVTAETFYDKQGRPAIQILPTPGIIGTDNVIAYRQNLNLFNGQANGADPSDLFDLAATVANANFTPPLLTTSGSAQYYSNNNGDLASNTTDGTKNIPDAGGYPFTQTQYTPDGTGRVAAQGGVGSTYQLGNGRETKYFYGKPLPAELDGLFGSEVGDHQHYFKNMVVDANKQVSVSYVDMHGRTIATALAGTTPDGIKGINNSTDYPGQEGTGQMTSDLIEGGDGNIQKSNTLESLNTIICTASGTHYTFTYALPPATVTIAGCNGNITYTPKYDVEITMVNESTGVAVNLNEIDQNTGKPKLFDIKFMGVNSQVATPILSYTTDGLDVGSYIVRKTLTLREDIMQQDLQDYLKVGNGTCKSLKDFISEVFTAMKGGCDVSGAIPSSNFCLELGFDNGQKYKQDFVNTYLNNLGINPLNATGAQTADANIAAEKAYADAVSHCNTAANTISHRLADIEAAMVRDMAPYSGQYARTPLSSTSGQPSGMLNPSTGVYIPYGSMFNKYNIFAVAPQGTPGISHTQPYYKNPVNSNFILGVSLPLYTKLYYQDASGQPDASITPAIPSTNTFSYTILDGLTPDDFEQRFKPAWAKNLLPYHPEYNKLQFAKDNLQSSYDWIDAGNFALATTMQDAIGKGLLNADITSLDPFFTISAASAEKITMDNYLKDNWKGSDDGKITLWQMAYGNVKCLNEADDSHRKSCYENAPVFPPSYGSYPSTIAAYMTGEWNTLINNTDQKEADLIWNNFKTLYQSARDSLVNKYIDDNSPVSDDETLIAQGFMLHFPKDDAQAIEQMGGKATSSTDTDPHHWYTPPTNNQPAAPNGTAIATQQANNVNDVVAGYAQIWRSELLQNSNFTNTAIVPQGNLNALLNLIITGSTTDDGHDGSANGGFMGICKKAINDAHPNGATDLPQGMQGILDVDNTYSTNFEQVFNKALVYANTHSLSATNLTLGINCNPYVIKFPTPYGASPRLINRVTNTVTECTCSEFAARVAEGGSAVLNSAGQVDLDLLNNFLSKKYKDQPISKPLFDALNGHCGNLPVINVAGGIGIPTGGPNSGGGTGDNTLYRMYTLLEPQPLPDYLVCGFSGEPVCLTCNAINTYSNDFVKLFGLPNGYTTVPLMPTGDNVLGHDEIAYNVLYANYINYRTGLRQSWSDYEAAVSGPIGHGTCRITICDAGSVPSELTVSDPITQPQNGYVAGLSIDVLTGFDYVVNNNTLQMTIDPNAQVCGGYNAGPDIGIICPTSAPLFDGTDILQPQDPCRKQYDWASASATHIWGEQQNVKTASFINDYVAQALSTRDASAVTRETFTVTYSISEYHYTLYYYDMAGSLVKTVPPKGVHPDYSASFLTSVNTARQTAAANGGVFGNAVVPAHTLATNYRYNTLGQVVVQNTPDAGTSMFWYDRLGRLAVSQNAKQFVTVGGKKRYSYTLYDDFGRIKEVGQKPQSAIISQDITQDDQLLSGWLTSDGSSTGVYNKEQITHTTYDVPYGPPTTADAGLLTPLITQLNLRNRVSYSEVFNVEPDHVIDVNGDPDATAYHASATYYTYDIHGNVNVLVQDFGNGSMQPNTMAAANNRYKRMQYDYDLISGKVNQVAYQGPYVDAGNVYHQNADAVYHRYYYDAENRLTSVETSRDDVVYERDAAYSYYRHGPLMQTLLGRVQELNYAYTLQGWLKSINAGWDGTGTVATTGYTATAAFGFSLHYYNNDYKAIGGAATNTVLSSIGAIDGASDASIKPLYNGNIAAMAVNIPQLAVTNTGNTGKPMVYHYGYDQLNRLVTMDAFAGANSTFTSLTKLNEYHEEANYDPNGNIMTYLRNGSNSNSVDMDKLTYKYEVDPVTHVAQSNKLRYIYDDVQGNAGTDDIKTQTPAGTGLAQVQADNNVHQAGDNYTYDEIGNLVKNAAEGISNISWTVYGKISSITRTDAQNNSIAVSYTYDVAGNRISKAVRKNGAAPVETWYVRDASGNVMGIYTTGDNNVNTGQLSLSETPLYGSSRLGEIKQAVNVQDGNLDVAPVATAGNTKFYLATFTRGQKIFELSNHLGNVLVTLSDKLVATATNDVNNSHTLDGNETFTADIVSAQDYYPGGSIEPGRSYNAGAQYRYGFNGKEKSDEIEGSGVVYDYGARIYDARIGRFLSVDPLQKDYPDLSVYQFAENSPIYATDLDGREKQIAIDGSIINGPVDLDRANAEILKQYPAAAQQAMLQHQQYMKHVAAMQYLQNYFNQQKPATPPAPTTTKPQGVTDHPQDFTARKAAEQNYVASVAKAKASTQFAPPQATLKAPDIREQYTDFEYGMVTNPLTQASASIVCGGCTFAMGGLQAYTGFESGNYMQGGMGLLNMGLGGLGMYSSFSFASASELNAINTENEIVLNSRGIPYPQVEIEGYGTVPFPKGPYTPNNSLLLRSDFTAAYKAEFKEWWLKQGYEWPTAPEGSTINIHHIKPLSKGGTNAFDNLVPLVQPEEHQPFTNWWRSYQ